mgnify:CR=1 FL=1
MDKKFTWTVDVDGGDFGGRTNGTLGIRYGIPKILEVFKQHKIKGLFFISTELLREHRTIIKSIKEAGHELGSHGHFHVVWKDKWRAEEDRVISNTLLSAITGTTDNYYRAPKFSYLCNDTYSDSKNHLSLLKHMWFNQKIPKEPIFYLHPFDIIKDKFPPNLFCELWYSRPAGALQTLKLLLSFYPGDHRL